MPDLNMQQKGFAMPLVLIIIGLIVISIIFSINNTIQTSNTIKTEVNSPYSSTNTQADSSVITKTPIPTITPIPTTFSGNTFSLTAKSESNMYRYTFTFTKHDLDLIELAVNPYDSRPSPEPIGVTIKRANVKLNIKVGFEAGNSPYEVVPEHIVINNSNLSKSTISRIKTAKLNTYSYTNVFGIGHDGCSQFKPEPASCSSSSINTDNEVFYISCVAETDVSTCDGIFKSLSYSRVLLK